jgi:hypothetical protein
MSQNFYGPAIAALRPGNAWGLSPADELNIDGTTITNLNWNDNNPDSPPTPDEIRTKAAELAVQYERDQYKKIREREYPPMSDYLDGVVKGDQAQIDAYIAACVAVKAKYPKPA